MKISRRHFILGSAIAGAGLAIGFSLSKKPYPNSQDGSFQPNAWLQILNSGEVIFQLDRSEMGQGVMTSLAMICAEELDYPPEKIRVEQAGIHPDYINSLLGTQLTGGSTSMLTSWEKLRQAGACARHVLIAAAAQQWQIAPEQCRTDAGEVINTANLQRLSYGELVEAARNLSLPSSVELKKPSQFRWLGTEIQRLDTAAKVDATAEFGIDVQLDDMKTAVVVRCPHFGGSVQSFNANKTLEMSGVIKVFAIHSGIAIVADSYWQARQAAQQLDVTWDKGPLAGLGSKQIREQQQQALATNDSFNVSNEGDIDIALSSTSKTLSAEYASPYVHHSPMEPQNASAIYKDGQMELWVPAQSADISRGIASHFSGVERERIKVNITLLGGGFGRRGYCDFAGEAAAIAAIMEGVAIKLVWSREDDMQHDYYRPASLHKVSASLDDNNYLSSWSHTLVSNSIIEGFCVDLMTGLVPSWVPLKLARGFGRWVTDWAGDYDVTMAEGAIPNYTVPNLSVDIIFHDPGVPTGFWRSVGHSYNAFVSECLMDEMAHLAQEDPLAFRLKHLDQAPELKQCLEEVAKLSGWQQDKPGVYRGVASHSSFLSHCAQVVEISRQNGQISIDKVYCVVNAGRPLTPNIIRDQMMSGIIYGLTAATQTPVNIEDGRAVGSNFHDLPVLRMSQCPEIEVVVLDSENDPTGVGEVGVPPIAPALGNALFQLTGERQREMPFKL